MGFWDFLHSMTDKLKIDGPVLTPVTKACHSSYHLSCAAVSKVDNVVRVHGGQKLKECWRDSEGQEKIGRILKYGANFAAYELLKWVPWGVPIYKIMPGGFRSIHDNKKDKKKKLNEMQKKIVEMQEEMNKISSHNKILLERIEGMGFPRIPWGFKSLRRRS